VREKRRRWERAKRSAREREQKRLVALLLLVRERCRTWRRVSIERSIDGWAGKV